MASMELKLSALPACEADCDLLILPVRLAELKAELDRSAALAAADALLDGALLEAAREERFSAKTESILVLHTLGRMKAKRVMLLGAGVRSEDLRMACGKAVKAASKLGARRLGVAVPAFMLERQLRAAAEGLLLGAYCFSDYRTGEASESRMPASAELLLPPGAEISAPLEKVLSDAASLSDAVNWARRLVDTPAADMTPQALAEAAASMAADSGLSAEILDEAGIADRDLGMFLAVARGSRQPPKLIHLAWTPEGDDGKKPPLALVGKAITFDAGGLSLKTSPGMLWMKTDMAGAAAVLGAMKAIARMKPPFPVHAWMGACENMPGGNAYRLGDVLRSHSGKTVEVHDTDAEGRLVLGDMLALACDAHPSAVIDLATLTGAVAVALGLYNTGLFASDEDLCRDLLDASERAGESMWRLPLDERLRSDLDSPVADLKNLGDRYGGSITAALFLQEFVGGTPWAHLDIAGTARSKSARGYLDVGASGAGVRTLVEYVRALADRR